MPNLVQISDFTGEFQLQIDNATTAKFNQVRDNHETDYIYKLLGVSLGKLFIANLNVSGVPTDARFLSIYNAFSEDYNNEIIQSKGMKFWMKGVTWFYFARNNPYIIATGGNKVNKDQNSDQLTDGLVLARIYNDSVKTAKAIQHYINQNSSTYPEYNGQYMDFVIGL